MTDAVLSTQHVLPSLTLVLGDSPVSIAVFAGLSAHQNALLGPEAVREWSQWIGLTHMVPRADIPSSRQPLQRHPGHTLLCCHLTGADPVAFGRRADRRSSSAQGWTWPLQLTELPRTNPGRMLCVINAALETCVRSCNTFRLLQCIRLHDTIRAEHAPVAPAPAACSSAHTASSWRCSWGCSDSLPAGCPEQLLLQDGAWSPGALRRAQAAARL